MRGLDRILELQDLDTSIERLEHRREQLEGGEELSSLRKEMEEADARLGELRLASDSISSESARLEHEIASMSDKLHAEEKRMYDGSIANAKELEALQHEIVSLKERRSRTEDDLLEQMVRREDSRGPSHAVARPRQRRPGRASRRSAVDAVRELDTISADISAKRSEREALTPAFDEELLRALRRPARAEARRRARRDRGRGVPGVPREALGRRARPPETHRGREEV
jgi:predicted  nucleic acid-binding Zn-ribbon protein